MQCIRLELLRLASGWDGKAEEKERTEETFNCSCVWVTGR